MLSSELRSALYKLAEALSPSALQSLVSSLEHQAQLSFALRQKTLQALPLSDQRTLLSRVFDLWPETLSPVALITALEASAHSILTLKEASQVELVWTGPTEGITFRRTDQALLQVIEAAERELWIVTFVAYSVPSILAALQAALQRGVRVRFLGESPETDGGRVSFGASAALGELASQVTVYVWPKIRREESASGKVGTLHAKFALADDRVLFVSSANLTDHALNLNMEMGVLLTGGDAPKRVHAHVESLMAGGAICPDSQNTPNEVT